MSQIHNNVFKKHNRLLHVSNVVGPSETYCVLLWICENVSAFVGWYLKQQTIIARNGKFKNLSKCLSVRSVVVRKTAWHGGENSVTVARIWHQSCLLLLNELHTFKVPEFNAKHQGTRSRIKYCSETSTASYKFKRHVNCKCSVLCFVVWIVQSVQECRYCTTGFRHETLFSGVSGTQWSTVHRAAKNVVKRDDKERK